MSSVRSHAKDMSMFVVETVETSPGHCNPCTEDRHDTERESLSQPLVNVSQDMCLVVASAEPQACPTLSPSKFPADVTSAEEYSQVPAGGAQVVFSQQPSPEILMSLGVKVRDFAYENTLPAIVPVPRVPRQVQPAPRALKRSQRDWDDKEGSLNSSSQAQSLSERTGSKRPRSLERKPTEPLQEPVVQHTRTLGRITVKRVCTIITPSPRRTLAATPRTRLSASPPTSPLMPPLLHPPSRESGFIQMPSTFPFVVHVDDISTVPASQLDSESQPVSLHPVLYTRFTLDSRSPPGCSPAASPPQNTSSVPPITPLMELPSTTGESGADLRVRKRRGRGTIGTTPPNRYQLRERPTPSSRASPLSKSLPRRTRRVR